MTWVMIRIKSEQTSRTLSSLESYGCTSACSIMLPESITSAIVI